MAWVPLAISAGSAILGAMGSQNASNAQVQAAQQALELQRQNRDIGLTAYEPNRMLGYGATSDLSSLYGYATPGYTPLNQLLAMGGGGSSIGGGGSGGSATSPYGSTMDWLDPAGIIGGGGNPMLRQIADPLGIFGGGKEKKPLTGTVNYGAGTVDTSGKNWKDQAATEYLRTGIWPSSHPGSSTADLRAAIDRIRAQGYTYTPGQAGDNGTTTPGTGSFPGATPPTAAGAPSMSRFFTSPDYTYRQQAGQSALDRSAAARGGALSGNAIAGGVQLAGNLASNEYGNYVNRLLAMAGLGQTATEGAVGAGNQYATNAGNLMTQQGDARASGVLGQYGALQGGLNSFASLYGSLYGNNSNGLSVPSIYTPYMPVGK